jgi:serine/threonine protein kinase
MELCEFDLADFILNNFVFPASNGKREEAIESCSELSLKQRFRIITMIMTNISNGLAFIHSRNEVHRDLKPANGVCPTTS